MKHPFAVIAAALALLALGFASRPVSAAPATVIADPATFVQSVYARHAKGGDYIPPDDIYTPHLAGLWALEEHEAHGEVGRIDFLFWIDGQDGTPSDLHLRTVPVEGRLDRRIIVATFKNGDQAENLRFYFQRGATGWKLDDVVSLTGKSPWTLSVILKYGWVD
jgi:hypothetical protein